MKQLFAMQSLWWLAALVSHGSAVTLLGPQPAVIASDTGTGQFDLMRLS